MQALEKFPVKFSIMMNSCWPPSDLDLLVTPWNWGINSRNFLISGSSELETVLKKFLSLCPLTSFWIGFITKPFLLTWSSIISQWLIIIIRSWSHLHWLLLVPGTMTPHLSQCTVHSILSHAAPHLGRDHLQLQLSPWSQVGHDCVLLLVNTWELNSSNTILVLIFSLLQRSCQLLSAKYQLVFSRSPVSNQ